MRDVAISYNGLLVDLGDVNGALASFDRRVAADPDEAENPTNIS